MRVLFLISLVFAYALPLSANNDLKLFKKPVINILVKKQGVYFGYERGMFDILEIGGDYQRKRITGLKSNINAFHYGFNYSIRENVAGYSIGYYYKKGAFGLTYGADLFGSSDFKKFVPAISPVVGFKFAGFHVQSGYKFSYQNKADISVNTFFIRLRFTLNQHTKWKNVNRGNKKD